MDSTVTPKTCEVCHEPLRSDNDLGVCRSTAACRRERARRWRSENQDASRAESQRYRSKHIDAVRGKQRAHYRANPLRVRANSLRNRYGITPEQYDSMLAAQGGHCAICPAMEPGRGHKHFIVDHDHTTGKVRGLLCHTCNAGIGLLKDSVELVACALAYLRKE